MCTLRAHRDNTSFGEGDQRNVIVYIVCTGIEHERTWFSMKTLSKENLKTLQCMLKEDGY
jgi:hypothetical protein